MSNESVCDWAAILSGLAALGVLAVGLTAEYGMIETFAFWPIHVFGLAMIGLAGTLTGSPCPSNR